MLRSILVGLDGSCYSRVAVELGIDWAKRCDALLVGVAVVDEPTIRGPEAVPIGGGAYKRQRDEKRLAEARSKVEQFLESFRARCTEAGVACHVLEDIGLPSREILRESPRYDLVLFGRETHFHFETQDRADETLRCVLRHETRPVAVAPREVRGGTSVVVAYNGRPSADRALQAFEASGLDYGEEIHLVTVDADHSQAACAAEKAADFLRFHGIHAQTRRCEPAGSVAQTILEEVRKRDARLLVMGAYRHSSLRESLFGSVTKDVLRDSRVPVFLCS